MSPKTRLSASIAALLAVYVIGMVGFLYIEAEKEPTVLDAAFMTAITLSTVGYEEVWRLSDPGRVWAILVITFGIATVSVAFTSLIALFVSGELRSQREKELMLKKLEAMHRHVILCGFGRMGRLIATNLSRMGESAAIVEVSSDLENDIRELGLPYIIGDATDERVLARAGIDRARALICALPHDADNVFITLTANSLNPKINIIARAEQMMTEGKLKRAGANRVICPQAIGAMRIVDVLTRPNVVDFVEVANEGVHLEMDEYIVPARSHLVGHTLQECRLREKTDAMVVAIKRDDGETIFSPGADTVVRPRDTLVLVGKKGVSHRIDDLENGEVNV